MPDFKYTNNHVDSYMAQGGRTGITNHSGSGEIYISPLKVISNDYPGGTNIASDGFKKDTIVDTKPYTPVNFHPDYSGYVSGIGKDTTGFLLDTTNNTPSIVYYKKEGVDYPVMCRWIPETNLSWDNYIYTGQVIKPKNLVEYCGTYYNDINRSFSGNSLNIKEIIILQKIIRDSFRCCMCKEALCIKNMNFNCESLKNYKKHKKYFEKNSDIFDRLLSTDTN